MYFGKKCASANNLKTIQVVAAFHTYYLCGPPMMIRACSKMLADLGVCPEHIAFDEF